RTTRADSGRGAARSGSPNPPGGRPEVCRESGQAFLRRWERTPGRECPVEPFQRVLSWFKRSAPADPLAIAAVSDSPVPAHSARWWIADSNFFFPRWRNSLEVRRLAGPACSLRTPSPAGRAGRGRGAAGDDPADRQKRKIVREPCKVCSPG